jgi:hypothetical protein
MRLELIILVVVIAREAGDYTVATSMRPPGPCQVFEFVILAVTDGKVELISLLSRNPKSVREIGDPLQKAIIQYS